MLYEVEPDSSITGGAWYNDHKFDHEFADVLNHYCLVFLEEKVGTRCVALVWCGAVSMQSGVMCVCESVCVCVRVSVCACVCVCV